MKYFLLLMLFTLSACSTLKGNSSKDQLYFSLCFDEAAEEFYSQKDILVTSQGENFEFKNVSNPDSCIFESQEKFHELKLEKQTRFAFVCSLDLYYEFVVGGEDFSLIEKKKTHVKFLNNVTHAKIIVPQNYCNFSDYDQ